VEGGDDDRKLGQTGGGQRVFGGRFDGVIHERQRIAAAASTAKAGEQHLSGENGPNEAPKCQRPRTEGARTSGAAKPFMVVPAPELVKRQRRRSPPYRDGQWIAQGVGLLAPGVNQFGTSRITGPLGAGAAGAAGAVWVAAGLGGGFPNWPI